MNKLPKSDCQCKLMGPQEEVAPDMSISIVTSNNKKLILECLTSIYENIEDLQVEIYVVINNSLDETETAISENFPDVKILVNNRKNIGFSYNQNLAIKRSRGRFILVLNDDTLILPYALTRMVRFMESHSDVGLLGCRILNPDGSRQWSCGKSVNDKFEYFKSGVLRPLFCSREQHFNSTQEVSWLTGACMLARARAVREVGLFDENFMFYYEDGDWCYRMLQHGWKVMFYPQAEIIHYRGQTRKHQLGRHVVIIQESALYFYAKHFGPLTNFLVRVFTCLGGMSRYVITLLTRASSEQLYGQKKDVLAAYKQVMKLALLSPFHTKSKGAFEESDELTM